MNADEPGRLPPGVDLVALAGLVAPLLTRDDAEVIAQRVSEQVIATLRPHLERIEAAARVEQRRIGPYVPPPPSTTN